MGSGIPRELAISAGRTRGLTDEYKYGRNTAVGTSYEVVSDLGGSASFLAAAEILDISSGDGEDHSASSGARTIRIFGTDDDGDLIQDDISMQGTTAVETSIAFKGVYRMEVLTAGSTEINQGAILAAACATGVSMARITADEGRTLMCVYRIPRNHVGYLYEISVSVQKGDDASIRLRERTAAGVIQTRQRINAYQSEVEKPFRHPLSFAALSDVFIEAKTTNAGGSVVNADLDLVISEGDS